MKPFRRYAKLSDPCSCGSGRLYRACCFRGEVVCFFAAMAVLGVMFFLPPTSRLHRTETMDTRELIYFMVRVAYSIFLLAGILYFLYVGVRHGFRFPRWVHITAVVLVMLEAFVLVLFPLPLASITPVLGAVLAVFPLAPYIAWVVMGGPQSLHER